MNYKPAASCGCSEKTDPIKMFEEFNNVKALNFENVKI